MNTPHDDANEPRWLRLAAAVHAEPDPGTLARVRARLAARPDEPSWVRWLARPAALAVSAALLVVSAVLGAAFVWQSAAPSDEVTVVSALLGDDGSFGLGMDRPETSVQPAADSEGVSL